MTKGFLASGRLRFYAAIFLFLVASQHAALAQDRAAKIQEVLALAHKYRQFNGAALVAENGKVIYKGAFGMANMEWNIPNTPDTKFRLGSITKQFTAMLTLQLVEQGKIKLDGKITDYLPDYRKDIGDKVTVHHLLTHTSGIPSYTDQPGFFDNVSRNPYKVSDFVKKYASGDLQFEPGSKFTYNNSGYFLLGAIIERVTGTSFYDYVDRHIFRPAGMTVAGYPELDAEISDIADPLTNLVNLDPDTLIYRSGTPRKAMAELAGRGGPQGGAVMSARDLLKFDQALRSGKLISAPRLNEMMTPVSPSGAGARGLVGDVREGLGIEVVRQNGHLFYGHTGGDLGVASMTYWYPDSGYTIILLTNRDPRAGRVLANVSRALLTRHTIGDGTPPAQHCLPPSP